MKKLFIILTALVLFCGADKNSIITKAYAQSGKKVGDSLSVHFDMTIEGLASGLGFNVIYDTTKLRYVDCEMMQYFDHENCVLQNGIQGTLVTGFNQIFSDPLASITADILVLNFVAIDTGYTEIIFEEGIAVLNENEIDSEWVNTNLTIQRLDRMILRMRIE